MGLMRMREASNAAMDSSKYIRYTPEQVEALERVYTDCPKPSSIRRQQLLREYPILANIEPRQLKVWFQNRRCREKQRKETTRLQSVNSSLSAMNKIIMEENERLTKHSSQLALENQYLRQQLREKQKESERSQKSLCFQGEQAIVIAADRSPDSEVTGGLPQQTVIPLQHSHDSSPAGLLSLAEETLKEFLAKATGTAVDWIQMPGMKPGPDCVGTVAISHGSAGVAARAWGLVGLEPTKVAGVLKDRPAWLQDCRRMDVMFAFSTPSGGTVELLYTQMYALTTLAPAQDFYTLRYTTFLDDGHLVVCERSLNCANGGPSPNLAANCMRAEMLPSGFLVRPYEGGVCSIHLVDHMDLQSWRVLEVVRPLYESSAVLAQHVTLPALRHLQRVYEEGARRFVINGDQQSAAMRALSCRIARGFNEAVNAFPDEGWSPLVSDGKDDVSISVNLAPNSISTGGQLPSQSLCSLGGGIICAKASMLLQNVPPGTLMRFLRQHRSEWAGFTSSSAEATALLRTDYGAATYGGASICIAQIPVLSSHAPEEEFLEVIKFEGLSAGQAGALPPKETVLLQLCSGLDNDIIGASAQLVFAPVNAALSDDVPLLPSGFRVIPLDSGLDGYGLTRTRDLASALEFGVENIKFTDVIGGSSSHSRSVLTMAFQFVFEVHNRDDMVASARHYVRNVMGSVQGIALALAPSRLGQQIGPRAETLDLAKHIFQSYRMSFGLDLMEIDSGNDETLLNVFWHHKDAFLCCTWKTTPEFIFANRAGLQMLEITWKDLKTLPWEKTLDEDGKKSAYTELAQVIQQGCAYLQGGVRLSSKGRPVIYERALAWKVLNEDQKSECIAFMFLNWSFLA
ncbi:hypothetical protein O6H91_21G048400 [Diphasiastrum complanatum]|uniref:Uncharacterized protein n=4 Tax=Diphasiastrum complanatum TaxID=34168 RepID=A0ACC2AK91_DIPCM|nr:hypothetical protein O6H91_21G048400 [Diphasiastrum complanatum]KAJ7517966.1 hypothetical protein O6H91_21G048400 [Diphasiastrum complanatum]KAJ7517967.1 hypothetical protein O6H91_21G048400 [Diphasiastrum complanatum]KAJ7517968.1 hypothetical protein O6H91_21G048400 [Diphasiastrum complanatum]